MQAIQSAAQQPHAVAAALKSLPADVLATPQSLPPWHAHHRHITWRFRSHPTPTPTNAIEIGRLDRFVEGLATATLPLVSSKLCEALLAMHDQAIGNALDIGFDWSALQALPQGYAAHAPIRFQPDYFSRIEEVSNQLRVGERQRDGNFIGTVERLDGEMGDDGQRAGDVILALFLPEGERIRVRTRLDAVAYAKANRAHMTDGVYVQVSGCLHPGRQPRLLSGVGAFEVI